MVKYTYVYLNTLKVVPGTIQCVGNVHNVPCTSLQRHVLTSSDGTGTFNLLITRQAF